MAGEIDEAGRDNAGRFRAGAPSPNPRGRPRKINDVDAALIGALSEKVMVTEQGRRTRKTKLDITAAQLANKGAGGELRAVKMVLDQARKSEERALAHAGRAPVMTKTDREIAALVVERIAKFIMGGGSDGTGA